MTTAISVLAFSVVLAEAFIAIGLSTLLPASFVQMCRVVRALILSGSATAGEIDGALNNLLAAAPPLPGMPPPLPANATDAEKAAHAATLTQIKNALRKLLADSDKLQLLVPKSASIDAEFACSGGESYSGTAAVEGVFQVVGIKAGYSALFEMKSSASVRLHVDFAPVEFSL